MCSYDATATSWRNGLARFVALLAQNIRTMGQ